MAEDLKHLLERIEQDAVAKAEVKAAEILAAAEEKAHKLIRTAEKDATLRLDKADKDAAVFQSRATNAIRQAARDTILSVGASISSTFEQIVGAQVAKSLGLDTLKQMLTAAVQAYTTGEQDARNVSVLVNPDVENDVRAFLMSSFANAMKAGLTVQGDNAIITGFKVHLADKHIEHDFSHGAITETLCRLLQPRIADIVRGALADHEARLANGKS